MYKVVCNSSYNLQVEAAKAYAMLCIAEQKENNTTTTYNSTDDTKMTIVKDKTGLGKV